MYIIDTLMHNSSNLQAIMMFTVVGPHSTKSKLLATIKNACLPKLICELNATPQKEKLTDSEKSLLSLIR